MESIINSFLDMVCLYPDNVAVKDRYGSYSYRELDIISNKIANFIIEECNNQGIDVEANINEGKQGERIGIILPRKKIFLAAFLGIMKAGCCIVNINPDFPSERKNYMINDANCRCIISSCDIDKTGIDGKIFNVEDFINLDDKYAKPINLSKLENEGIILYTSGSTGVPKGVIHKNKFMTTMLLDYWQDHYKFTKDDNAACMSGFSFTVSLFELLNPIARGSNLYILDEEERLDFAEIYNVIKKHNITFIFMPPKVIKHFSKTYNDLPLKFVGSGGEKLQNISKTDYFVVENYGSSEAGPILENLLTEDDSPQLLGKPVDFYNAYLIDEDGNEITESGIVGELCITGEFLSMGYLNLPEQTAEKFVDCPFENDTIMFKTGDLMEWNDDGLLLYHGRNDFMVKFNGMRVELAEIELAVLEDENILEAVCVLKNINGEENLICYFSCDASIDDEETYILSIKNRISQKLASYMVPSIFVKLDALPRNVNGKISHGDLPEVDVSLHKKEFIKPSSEFEILVADAFSKVLNIDADEISINDDFVALGGNSLSAMKLQLTLKENVDVSLSSNELMELSTPLNISKYIKSNLNNNVANSELEYSFDEICPLSESQLNVYLDEMVNEMGTGYNNAFRIEFENKYSVDEIKNALIKLFDTYPILKARVVDNSNNLSGCIFDADVKIGEGSLDDIESFVRPFELNKSLSRYLIVVDDESVTLCMDIHHLIFDGTSLNILVDKLFSILNGGDVDFVDNGILRQISFEKNLNSTYLQDAHEFLDSMLADRDEAYELLPSIDKDNQFEYRDTFKINNGSLSLFLQNKSLTHNQFFASVFAYTLSRFTGSSKVLFNLIEDGRGHIDLSESVGMFVKTVPILMDCKNQDVDSFFDYSSSLINSVMKYDLYPFYVLANQYDLSTDVFFQYSHNIFNNDNVYELKHDLQRDLSFFIFNNDDELSIKILFSDKYSKEFIEHFVHVYKSILKEIMDVNELSDINYNFISDLDLLDSYNRTEAVLKYDDILDAFNDNLSKYPDNNLVSYKDASYTYSEGAFIADKVAKSLMDLGIKNQDYVAFLVERSELYMFTILGILSAGAIYVPLDDAHPDERIQFILEDTNPKVAIVSDETYNRVKGLSENLILLNISDILRENIGNLSNLPVVCDDLACILYTSGTTGVPKGVKITRKAVINFAEFYIKKYSLSERDIFALFASIGFDVSMEGIFSSIYAGACLNIIPDDIKLDMDALNNHFMEHDVTYAHLPAQVAKLFINQNNTSLKVLCTGGEKLGEIEITLPYRFVDSYGPTETFIDVTSIDVNSKVNSSSIGFLFDNIKAYVLDEEFRRVPVGAVGELYLAGYQVANGYLNREEETDNAFLDNPFEDNEDYNVMYRTGDLVRVLPDGSLGIIGRSDRQVKIRGNRLELSEVESVIRSIDIVEDVTVQTVKNDANYELVAYVVLSGEKDNFEEYISNYINERKPEYMVPSFIIPLDEIPLNVNGKVDKHALPEVNLDSLRAKFVAPRNETEKIIVEAFEKVFNQENISIYDNFMRLGGDSLTAIKVLSYLKDYNITAADILRLHTPYAIAENIQESLFDLNIYSLESGCPLNESQLNVYLDIIANDKFNSYLIPVSKEISKKYGIDAISEALRHMLNVHPILAMCVSDEYDVPYLVRGSEPEISIESNVNEDYIIEFLTKPFDLYDSLCRFLIVENNDNYELFAVFHHIIFDALSDVAFNRDLESILDGESIDLDDSFLKVAAFNQQIQKTDEYGMANDFYDAMLADIDDAGILLDSVSSDGSGKMEIALDFDINSFKEFLNTCQISENVFFTSVFAYTLSRFVGSDEVVFTIVENGRDRFNNFNSIGMYVNTLPLFVDCRNMDISSFMKNMSGLVYDVMRYNYYPFRLLAKKYDIDSNIQFQFMPDWINDEVNIQSIDLEENDLLSEMGASITDLSVDVIQKANKYSLNIYYSEKYSSDFIQHFAESYKLILQDMLQVDELSDINYITNDDIQLLNSYNKTEYPLEYEDVLDAFNDNLKKYPNSALVSMNDNVYSYAEGAYIADKIAKDLLDFGVESGDHVGFLTNRSEYYMFSVLGILSMGGVYVPLDDAHPDERIRFILEDTKSKVVIVSDDTYNRVKDLSDNVILFNISDIIKEGVGTLSYLHAARQDLACILYTSGTTGVPKGVKITRKSILNLAEFFIREYELTNDNVYALFASIGFDVAIKAIFSSICAGACLTIIPDDIKLDMNAMNEYFIKYGVTHTEISTQVAKLFISQVDSTSLKVLTTGGEKLGENEIDVNYRFADSYGPTEACVDVTSIDVDDRIDYSSIGFLLDNIKAYILDDEFRRVPIGAVGELFVAGNQIAKGYLNRDEETRKAFLENPFDYHGDYSVMYRTGDMVRVLPDGSLGIVGRRDGQVKIRGNRVELSEIESVIREIEYVDDVTVQTITHNTNNELVAYVVVSNEISENNLKENIFNHVADRKPKYMIPSFVMKLDEIPLTVNGKVDKRALPEVNLDSLYADYVAPTNENEKAIVKAFESVFDREQIGIHDDFVRLGGDSIIAIRLISLLQEHNIHVTARDILNNKTPALIAQNVIEDFEVVSYDAVEGVVDLLPIQNYFFNQINKDNYVQEFILKANRDLDINILQSAINELTNQHDMLRAIYRFDENNNPNQEILPLNAHICTVNEFDVTEDFEDNLSNIIENSINLIDITNKIMDVNLIHYNGESYLIIILHHLIVDGVSWNILINDLTNIYNKIESGQEIKLRKSYPYKNWVNDVRNLVDNISLQEKQKWIDINESIDENAIKGPKTRFEFNVDVKYDVDNLLMLSEEEYWVLALSRAYKKTYGDEMIFERESHGRDDNIADLNRTVGWFTSQYPVKIDVKEKSDSISLMLDIYNVKKALKDVKHLGLNYASLIYTTHELEYKHCPLTFNFLSSEFSFKNELFDSYPLISSKDDVKIGKTEDESYGITFNVSNVNGSYNIRGDYADGTYISNKFNTLIENLKDELDFIADYNFENEPLVCCLSEPQLGVYLDEMVHDKGTAYASPGSFDCGDAYSVEDVKHAIFALIDKHPILKSRVLVTDEMPLLVCDADPPIEVVDEENDFIKTFDFENSLVRFFIVENPEGIKIFYDMHHMISDATTSSIMDNDLRKALSGKLEGAVDYGFLYAGIDSFESKFGLEYENAQIFFKEKFADIDEIQYLQNDIGGSVGKVGLPIRGVREAVESFAHKKGITVSNFLNAVFAYTYSRFIGGDKVYYNFTEHGRHDAYSQDAVSMFVRTIPILVNCENKSVNDYLINVSDLILDSMSNNSYPFRLLANEFNLSMDVTFEYNYDLNDMSDIGDEIIFYEVGDRVAELLCVVNDLDDGYFVGVSHLNKYSTDTITRFVYVFKEVLTQFLEKENLEDINYVSREDIKLLDNINQTDYPIKHDDILDVFNDNLFKYQDNKMVSGDEGDYSYGEGAYIANKLAKSLIELGVKKQDHVAFLVDRSELYIFNVLGILSVGAVYVPLDDAHPDNRIQFILEDTDSKVVIVSDETIKRAESLAKDYIFLNISDTIKEDIESIDSLQVDYGDLACILYTSGTTGIPKGVKITRKSLLNVSAFYCDNYDLTNEDVYGLFSAIGFDVSNFILGAVLYSGACLSVIPEDIRLNMAEMNNYFIRKGVTHTFITTQVGKLFLESIDDTSLDVLLVAGEKLGLVESPCDFDLVDAYGPTEAFAFMSSINNLDKIHESSVGFLNYNTKVYVLDNEFRRVPVGAVGELCIAGFQLAEGYLNREEETQNAFIENPFDSGDYGLLYRTGDMIRILPDGTLGIVGRRDTQVKIRGNRVELSEVESTIRKMDNIKDVTVQTITKNGNNELVAYVSAYDENDNIEDSVRDYVSESKPYYMVPSHVIILDEIPVNVNGKVDKQKLPEVSFESRDYEAPKDSLEKVIADAFSEILNIEQPISRNDEFTALGGDSIGVIMLISKLGELNIQITVKEVLENQSVKKIAEHAEYKISLSNISQDSFEGFVDTTPNINYFWDLNLKNPSYFNVPFLLEASKRIDGDILEKAVRAVVNHHDMLRAIVKDGKLFVRPQNADNIFTIETCDSLDYAKETKRINEEIDIFNGPLVKLAIFNDEDCDKLYVTIHHLLMDSDSLRVFINDLNLAYVQISRNKKVNLYNKTSSYREYAYAVDKYRENDELLKQANYWKNISSSLKKVNHTVIDSNIRKWDSFSLKLPRISSLMLFTNAPKFYDCSIRTLFLSIISKSWNQVTGEDTISLRLDNEGRFNFDKNILTERTVGWLDSYYPIVLKCSDKEYKEIIDNTKKTLDDVPQNGFGYPILMGVETNDIPLFYFNYLREFNKSNGGKMFENINYPNLAHFTAPENNWGCDINIMAYTLNNETFFKFEYNSERFTRELMEKFGNSFMMNIEGIFSFIHNDYSDDVHIFSNHPDKKKLFFVHTVNFGSEYFYYLAEKLKDEYSFIVIEPYNRNHKDNQLLSIEEYAAKYIEIIKSIQPEGPYYIGGYCFGGSIAHEIAVQLKKQNDIVDKLIILESYYIEDLLLRSLIIENQLLYVRQFIKKGLLDSKHDYIDDMISYVASSSNIQYIYEPSYYDGDVIYFKSTLQSKGYTTDISDKLDDYFMSKEAGGYEIFYDSEKLKIIPVPVDHDSLLNVEALRFVIPSLRKFIED